MFIFAVALLALSVNVAFAQPQVASFSIDATLFAQPLTLSWSSDIALFENLRAGVCYTTVAELASTAGGTNVTTGNITPVDGTALEDFAPAQLNLLGNPNAEVVVAFTLPSRLYPSGGAGLGHIDLSYDNHSGGVSFDGSTVSTFFNPQNGYTGPLGGDGNLFLNIGANACVSADANDGGGTVFSNQGLVTAEYTGN